MYKMARKHASVYIILTTIARDVLAISMSIIVSESCFNVDNRVLDDKRN